MKILSNDVHILPGVKDSLEKKLKLNVEKTANKQKTDEFQMKMN